MKRRTIADATDYKGQVLVQIGTSSGDGSATNTISVLLTIAESRRLRRDLLAAEERALARKIRR